MTGSSGVRNVHYLGMMRLSVGNETSLLTSAMGGRDDGIQKIERLICRTPSKMMKISDRTGQRDKVNGRNGVI
ncbi:Guanine nucleotide-binding protein alpha-3 subunit [Fusarium oxysporum f. sp. albedinis]|nr:Guanine nucleotide-binding protein alpha-3 subunit [Fusarium oxysporum f. sp. albedinis]